MPIDPEKVKVGSLVSLEGGSYYCMGTKKFVPICHNSVGVVIHVFWYDDFTYPWRVLGYKFLVDVVVGCHKLRDVPDFKVNEVTKQNDR